MTTIRGKKLCQYQAPKKLPQVNFTLRVCQSRICLNLGKVLSKMTAAVIGIYKFHFEHMQWSNVPVEAEFMVAKTPFAYGGFRQAFKATSITEGFKEVTWVIKKLKRN